jgi:hypothetical protein
MICASSSSSFFVVSFPFCYFTPGNAGVCWGNAAGGSRLVV